MSVNYNKYEYGESGSGSVGKSGHCQVGSHLVWFRLPSHGNSYQTN